jgi:hypothetical protein
VHASFEPRGGGGMPEGRDGHTRLGHAGTVCGGTEGALATGPAHGRGRCGTVVVIPPGGGQEPGRMTRGVPGGASQSAGICGQRDVPVCGALAAVAMDLEARAIEVGDLQGEGFLASESQARDGGEGDWVVSGGGGRE